MILYSIEKRNGYYIFVKTVFKVCVDSFAIKVSDSIARVIELSGGRKNASLFYKYKPKL